MGGSASTFGRSCFISYLLYRNDARRCHQSTRTRKTIVGRRFATYGLETYVWTLSFSNPMNSFLVFFLKTLSIRPRASVVDSCTRVNFYRPDFKIASRSHGIMFLNIFWVSNPLRPSSLIG